MDEKKINPMEELEEADGEELILTLEDDEGNTYDFLRRDEAVIDGKLYYALVPLDESLDEEDGDYVILRVTEEGEELSFESPEPDEEDKVAEYFDDKFFSEVDYDAD